MKKLYIERLSKSHSDEDTSPKGLSVLNLSIFWLSTSLYKVSSYNSYQVFNEDRN